MRIVSTERGCTPQVDLWSGGGTLVCERTKGCCLSRDSEPQAASISSSYARNDEPVGF